MTHKKQHGDKINVSYTQDCTVWITGTARSADCLNAECGERSECRVPNWVVTGEITDTPTDRLQLGQSKT